MTDRPRAWTLYDEGPDGAIVANGHGFDPEEPVRVVEWDRERTVPVIEKALLDFADAADHTEWHQAEAIFDALDREQT